MSWWSKRARSGSVTTGHTTAKVSQLQGTMLQRIRGRNTASTLAAYVESQARRVRLARRASPRSTGVEFERRDGVSATPRRRTGARRSRPSTGWRARTGSTTELVDDAGLPFPTYGAVRLREQGQIDPMRLLAALAAELREHGGTLVTGARVTGVGASRFADQRTGAHAARRAARAARRARHRHADPRPRASTSPSSPRTAATRRRGGSRRSSCPTACILGVEQPTRSLRDARGLLLTGGNGHGVGRHPSPRRAADELADWTREHWPGAELVAEWSAQDYLTPHGVPFVGWLPRGGGKVYLATGFSKWGMTNGVATALTLVGGHPGRLDRVAAGAAPADDASGGGRRRDRREPGRRAAGTRRSWARALAHPAPPSRSRATARSAGAGSSRPRVSTVDGATNAVCAVCPHLGAVVQWNDFERSWDCPAHGSRFAPDGTVLEGPAKRALRSADVAASRVSRPPTP